MFAKIFPTYTSSRRKAHHSHNFALLQEGNADPMNTHMRGLARVSKTTITKAQCRFASSGRQPVRGKGKGTPNGRSAPLFDKPTKKVVKPTYTPKAEAPKADPLPKSSSKSPPPPPPPPDTLASLWNSRGRIWIAFSGASIVAGFLGYYTIGTAYASLKDGPASPCSCGDGEHTTPTGRPPALDGENAEQFDKTLNMGEWWMGITSLRKRISSIAQGEVLELAMGTGRNLEYYNWDAVDGRVRGKGILTFTGLDISVDMLDVARRKLVATVPLMKDQTPVVKASTMADHSGGQLSYLSSRLRLINSDAHHTLPPPPSSPTAKYDTIIQTFGLCSVSDPVAVVANLATAIKPNTGRIVLLEHGKGYFGIVNNLLDKNAGKHFEKYGCWWNRDIQGIVEEAAGRVEGLEVVKVERPKISQMGTMVWVELRVKDGSKEPQSAVNKSP